MKETFSPEVAEATPQPVTETFTRLEIGRDFSPVYASPRVPKIFNPEQYLVFFDPTQNELALQAEPPHYRTVTFEDEVIPIVKQDIKGQQTNEVQFVVNVKGVGWLRPSMEGDRARFHTQDRLVKDNAYDQKNLGFMAKSEAMRAIPNSEKLMRCGIDSEVIWYVANLEGIPYGGKRVPIRRLIEDGVIADQEYAIMTRLLKTNNRLGELRQRPEILEKALAAYSKHAKYNLEFDTEHLPPQEVHRIYLEYLMNTLGKNSARLINNDLTHNQIHGRNITLMGELVDTVSVQSVELPYWLTESYDDFRQMIVTANEFYNEYAELGLTRVDNYTALNWYCDSFVASLSMDTRQAFEKAHGRDLVELVYDFTRTFADQGTNPPTKRNMKKWADMDNYLQS